MTEMITAEEWRGGMMSDEGVVITIGGLLLLLLWITIRFFELCG